ncbi:hypothetical protein CPB84DRAFT_1850906 [Gymnopilus junonius]|uniref:Uncharacterized protein n=1 Tax=Gymnopilus junonius TaxID=109634 RepID=A0A9P5NFS4_GYMJU|nr:hypothetical protein CPB84DRAFT_1850906 [Gymnopilus junonius]
MQDEIVHILILISPFISKSTEAFHGTTCANDELSVPAIPSEKHESELPTGATYISKPSTFEILLQRKDGEFLEHRKAFDETISSQFSLVIDTFFSMISNKNINEPDLLASFYGQPLGPMFQYLVARQNTDSILKTLRTLTQAIKDFFPGSLGQRSDYFFYVSAFYARSHWLESDAEQWSSNEDVKNLLITLHTYADSGHNRDKTLGKRLGIPDSQDKWWEFLNML